MARRLARLALTLVLLASVAAATTQGHRLATEWPGSLFVERAADEVAAAVDAAVARAATPERVAARLEALLAEVPRNWVAIEAVEGVAQARGIAMPAALAARRTALHGEDHGALAQAAGCAACMWDPKACDFSAVLFCRVPVDLSPVGDVAGVVREGGNMLRGRPVDEVDLALSVVGLGAFALVPSTRGRSAAVALGAGAGKFAWRSGRLAPANADVLRHAAREGVDWARIGTVSTADDLAALARPTALRPAMALAEDAGRLGGTLGLRPGLYLLSRADTPAELRHLARASEALGPRTVGAVEILGKQRLIRATMRHADTVWATLGAVLAALAALASLAASLGTALAARLLRRAVRAPARP